MSAFDNSAYETARQQYQDEAKQRWGGTDAYRESQAKTAAYSAAQTDEATRGLMAVFGEFAVCRQNGNAPHSVAAQAIVKRLQDYITAHFYTCTKEILAGLGQMYVCDRRFKANIDQYGDGTAEFAAAAVEQYCK